MINDKRGVSPVVGTILLIAVTVALAAVIATIVGRIGVPAKAPYAILGVTAENEGEENVKITIIHRGGDTLVVGELKVRGEKKDGAFKDVPINWGDNLFAPGEEASGSYTYDNSEGKIIKIKVIHTPSGQLLLDTSVRVE
ncbi:MAG: type IV pilin N-terminal domain-containing protein [Candidatus Hodarchaeaceae archaeon]|nr:type IV pilin N-terminal domain-containing protein [Candidatus Hodarchaeaceae archaeon]